MRETNVPLRWSVGIRLLHWLTVVLLAAEVVVAFGPMKEAGMASMLWMPSHITIGVTILFIAVLRLGNRAFTRAPARPSSRWLRLASVGVHASLYALILAIVITGWLAYRPMPLMQPARLFGRLPIPIAPNVGGLTARDFIAIHSTVFWVLAALVALHVAAAAAHAIFRDGVMGSMLFRRAGAFPERPRVSPSPRAARR